MNKYVNSQLQPHEKLALVAKRNPAYLILRWVICIGGFVGLTTVDYSAISAGTLDGVIKVALLVAEYLPRTLLVFWLIAATFKFLNVELAVTDERIVGKYGVFNTVAADASLKNIQTVIVSQQLLGKLFNYSTVTITTGASSNGVFRFGMIMDANKVKNAIFDQMAQHEIAMVKLQAEETAEAIARKFAENKSSEVEEETEVAEVVEANETVETGVE